MTAGTPRQWERIRAQLLPRAGREPPPEPPDGAAPATGATSPLARRTPGASGAGRTGRPGPAPPERDEDRGQEETGG